MEIIVVVMESKVVNKNGVKHVSILYIHVYSTFGGPIFSMVRKIPVKPSETRQFRVLYRPDFEECVLSSMAIEYRMFHGHVLLPC